MHIFEEEAGPTTVTHSLVCKLDPSQSHENLVVVRGASLLQVFSIVHAPDGYTIPSQTLNLIEPESLLEYADNSCRKFLRFENEWSIDGVLTGLDLKRSADSTQLVLSFLYAKLVILTFKNGDFVPQSIHYYEKDIAESNFPNLNFPCKLLVESKGQCLSLWYQKDQFAILSFLATDELEKLGPSGSILLNSRHLEPACANIVDMQYLQGYNEPTLGVLYQKELTWTGDLIKHKDTVQFRVISVDVEQHNSTVISSVDDLPYDINQIVSLQEPIGGALLFGSNFFVYLESNGRSVVYAVNQFAQKTSDTVSIDYSSLGLDLDGCKAVQLPNSSHCLVVTAQGQVLDFNFKVDGFRVFGITIVQLRSCIPIYNPTALSVAADTVFIASKTGCSVLLSYELIAPPASALLQEDDDEEFEGVYTAVATTSGLKITLSDSLLSFGPITSLATIQNPGQVCIAFGREKSAGVAKLQKGLWPSKTFDAPKYSRFFTAGSYVCCTSHKQNKSSLHLYPDFSAATGEFLAGTTTLAFSFAEHSGLYWHIFTTGMAVYDSKLKLIWRDGHASQRSACISGKMALVCSTQGHNLELWQLQNEGPVLLESITTSNRYYLFEEHIAFANGNTVSLCSTHDPNSRKQLHIEAKITELVVGRIGDEFGSQLVLAIISGDVLSLYDLHSLRKLYSAPCSADLGLFSVKVGTLEGFAAGGRTPFVLFKGHKTSFVLRPLRCSRALCIKSIKEALLFTDGRKSLRAVQFEASWDYVNYGWPCSTLYVGESIQSISYNDTADVLAIGTNLPHTVPDRDPQENAHGDPDNEPMEEVDTDAGLEPGLEPNMPKCPVFASFIHIADMSRMTIVDTHSLGAETLVCLKSVRLEVADNTGHFKEFLAAGTSIMLDENSVANGHFLMFNVAELVQDGSTSLLKIKQVFKELCAGPVTALTEVMGKLAAAQGSRLLMRGVQEDHSIEPIAFTDLEIYTSELKSVRNIVISGDCLKSVSLINYGSEPKRLDVLARDPVPNSGVVCAEGLSSEQRQDLHVVASDREGRLRITQFDPDNIQSMGGPRLVLQTHLHIGAKIETMEMVYGKGEDLAALMGSEYGSLCLIVPLTDKDYRNLFVVSEQIIDREPTFACLNPRAHLSMGCRASESPIIYGPLVRRLWGLGYQKQQDYSKQLNGPLDVFEALSDDPIDYL